MIGRSADYDDQIKLIRSVIDEFSNVRREIPIGYAQCGNNVSFSLHYEEIIENQLSDCIHHLIMRGYIRSKMQFDLGNAYHRVCILLSFLLIASLVGVYWFATKVDNRYIRPRVLPNEVYSFEPNEDTTYNHVWDSVAIPYIMQDSLALAKILDNVTSYYFRDLNSFKGVKIWLKDIKDNDTLFYCVYSDMAKKSFPFSRIIPDSYCAGQVAKHRLFFLWPGVIGDSSFFMKNTKVVWTYHGDNDDRKHDTLVSIGTLDLNPSKLSWSGEICGDNGVRRKVELHWCDSNKVPDEELAAFFFSYDGCLVLEIDCFTGERITSDYDYMSHLMFRNSVRKYVNFVYYLLQQDKYKLVSQDKCNSK